MQPSSPVEPVRNIISYTSTFIYFLISFLLLLLSYFLLYPVDPYHREQIFFPEKLFQSTQSVIHYVGDIVYSLVPSYNFYILIILIALSLSASVTVFLKNKLQLLFVFVSLFFLIHVCITYPHVTEFGIRGLSSTDWYVLYVISLSFVLGYVFRHLLVLKSIVTKSVLLSVPLVIFLSLFFIKTSGSNEEYNLSLHPNSTNDCQGMKNGENKIKCFLHYSLQNNDLDACEHINSFGMFVFDVQGCESKIINNLEKLGMFEVSDCSNFKELISQNICYSANGIKKIDFSICDMVDDAPIGIHGASGMKGGCYYGIGEKIANTDKDARDCVTMNKYWEEGRNSCFKSVAIRKGNSSICNFINNESPDFTLCRQFFSLNATQQFQPVGTQQQNSDSVTIPVEKPQVPSDWVTYSNSEYGFSISYPSHFKPKEDGAYIYETATTSQVFYIRIEDPLSRAEYQSYLHDRSDTTVNGKILKGEIFREFGSSKYFSYLKNGKIITVAFRDNTTDGGGRKWGALFNDNGYSNELSPLAKQILNTLYIQ